MANIISLKKVPNRVSVLHQFSHEISPVFEFRTLPSFIAFMHASFCPHASLRPQHQPFAVVPSHILLECFDASE